MFSHVLSASTIGIHAHLVQVETHIAPASHSIAVVGLPDNAVKESKDRVYAAIKTTGFRWPGQRITINLAPADMKKEGSAFDLPIAIGILTATGQVIIDLLADFILLGELALDGTLRPIHGTLPIAVEAKRLKIRGIILPKENAKEAAMVEGLDVYPMESLVETVSFLNGEHEMLKPFHIDMHEVFNQDKNIISILPM